MVKKTSNEIPLIKYAFKFAYLGLDYKGLQKQPEVQDTIEEQIFKAFYSTKLLLQKDNIKDLEYTQCGRTDKKVSAACNVICIKLRVKEKDEKNLIRRINSALPNDIHFYSACKNPNIQSVRHQCLYREYKYFFCIEDLNMQKMYECLELFKGEQNFRHFCKLKPEYEKNGTIRNIQQCTIEYVNSKFDFLPVGVLTVRATGFLYHQIRCMISILKAVGRSDVDIQTVKQMLKGNKEEVYCYQMEKPDSLVLYNCEFEKDLLQFSSPSDYNKNFIIQFFSKLQQKEIRNFHILNTIKKQYQQVSGQKNPRFKKISKNFSFKKLQKS